MPREIPPSRPPGFGKTGRLAWWKSFDRGHWNVVILASLAWLFDCLDQQFFNLARDGALEDLLLDKSKATEFGPYTTSCGC